MTRKRYIKLLMALGLPRNRANFRASLCRDHRMEYAEDYDTSLPWLVPVMETAKDIREYLRQGKFAAVDKSTGTDYGCEIKGHKALTPDGREILVIDEMNLLPPLIKNEGELLQITVAPQTHQHLDTRHGITFGGGQE